MAGTSPAMTMKFLKQNTGETGSPVLDPSTGFTPAIFGLASSSTS
jgi:hypothetical protein